MSCLGSAVGWLRKGLIVFLVVLAAIASGLVASARWSWVGELAASFRWQLGWAGALTMVVLLALRGRRSAWLVSTLSVWLLWPGASLYWPRPEGAVAGIPLRVATLNVLMPNREGEEVRAWIRSEDPDIVAVQEVDRFWLDELLKLEDVWPYRVVSPEDESTFRTATLGIVLLSKRPLRVIERLAFQRRRGGIVAELDMGGSAVRILAVHTVRPGNPELVNERNTHLRMIAERAAWSGPCIVLGDLNTSSGSPAFGRLLRDGRLIDSRRGFGRQPTWRMEKPIPGLWVDIDHVLVSEHLAAVGCRRGPDVGSDHRPVAADLVLRRIARPDAHGGALHLRSSQ